MDVLFKNGTLRFKVQGCRIRECAIKQRIVCDSPPRTIGVTKGQMSSILFGDTMVPNIE